MESEQFARKASAETGHFAWDGKLRIKGSTGHVNSTQTQTQAWLKFSKPGCSSPWAKSSRHSCIYRLIQRRTVRPSSNSETQRTEKSLRPLCALSLDLRWQAHLSLKITPFNSFDLTVTVWDLFFLWINALAIIIRPTGRNSIIFPKTRCLHLFRSFWDVGWGLHLEVCADNENKRNLGTIRKMNAKEGILWNGCRESHTMKHSTSSRGIKISGNLKCLPRKSQLLLPVFCSRKPVTSVSGGKQKQWRHAGYETFPVFSPIESTLLL